MNKLTFDIERSKTQYDMYKYRLGENISYSKRKIYRYEVSGVVYDLKTEPFYKYLFTLGVSLDDWEKFKEEWEHKLYEFSLYDVIFGHLKGITDFNKFKSITLPEDLEVDLDTHLDGESNLELIVDWFRDVAFKPTNNQVYLVIFNR